MHVCSMWFTLNKISIKFRDISITWWCVSVESKFPARCYMREGTEQLHFALLLVSLLFGYFRKSFANCQSGNHSVFVCLCVCVSLCLYVCVCVCACVCSSLFLQARPQPLNWSLRFYKYFTNFIQWFQSKKDILRIWQMKCNKMERKQYSANIAVFV